MNHLSIIGTSSSLTAVSNIFLIDRFPCAQFVGSSPHTDWGFLTLILQDPVGGLQLFHDDQWIDVPYIPGTLITYLLILLSDGKEPSLSMVVTIFHY